MKTLHHFRNFPFTKNSLKNPKQTNYSKNTYVARETYSPRCEDCQYFELEEGIPVCKLFKYAHVVATPGDSLSNFYINNKFARIDSTLCGVEGRFFKPKIKK